VLEGRGKTHRVVFERVEERLQATGCTKQDEDEQTDRTEQRERSQIKTPGGEEEEEEVKKKKSIYCFQQPQRIALSSSLPPCLLLRVHSSFYLLVFFFIVFTIPFPCA